MPEITIRYEETIKSFQHFLELLDEFGDVDPFGLTLFRGQNCDKPLLPKIARLNEDFDIPIIEKKIFNAFKKRCLPYIKNNINSDWDYLSLAQHFGLLTRLLDWTENPLIALWFACQKNIDKKGNGVVWQFDPPKTDIIGANNKTTPFYGSRTKIFNPNHINERIKVQSGWFTAHMYIESRKKFIPLETNKNYKRFLYKIIIPRNIFPETRVKLNKMGINASTIFPDLDGVCKHINWNNLEEDKF